MKIRLPQIRGLFAAAAVGIFACGCAVVTVDVDVYKGPLANSHEVQGDQVITMAMGAKPILVQLRDHLEVRSRTVARIPSYAMNDWIDRRTFETNLFEFRSRHPYEPGAIRSKAPDGTGLRDELAIRVNEILGLYDDLSEPRFAAAVAEADRLIAEYGEAREILEPRSNTEAVKWWARIATHVRSSDVSARSLRDGYKAFYSVQRGPGADSWRSKTPPMDVKARSAVFGVSSVDSRNELFRLFLDKVVAADADTLFGNPATGTPAAAAKAAFVERTQGIAQSYFEARATQRRLLHLALTSIEDLQLEAQGGSQIHGRLLQALAESVAGLLDMDVIYRWARTESVGDMQAPDWVAKGDLNLLAANTFNSESASALRQALAKRLVSEKDLAGQILATDLELSRRKGREFGLSRGPTKPIGGTEAESIPVPDVRELGAVRDSLARFGGALDRGRAEKGIESAIEAFLKKTSTSESKVSLIDSNEGRDLLSALTQFGQKVAQLGNSVILMSRATSEEERQYVGVLQSVGNSILVHIDELKREAAHGQKLKERTRLTAKAADTAYSGTSGGFDPANPPGGPFDAKDVLVQLESLLRAEYVKALTKPASDNQALLKFEGDIAIKPDTGKVPGTYKQTDPDENAGGKVELQVPALTGKLTLTNGIIQDSPAARYAKAIEAVTQWREGMIYLRPASAYLRSSYPAALAATKSSQRSDNMLQAHAYKQIPFVGNFLDGVDNADLKTYLAMDRQSWQSVNRVKVAGAGRVNYVIAKDDIGNWYVKQYSTDRSQIFNSMRNVALFSAGNTFGALMPVRKSDGTILLRTNPVLEVQFHAALKGYSNSLSSAVGALKNDPEDFKTGLDEALKKLPAEAMNDDLRGKILTAITPTVTDLKKATAKAFVPVNDATGGAKLPAAESALPEMAGAWQTFAKDAKKAIEEGLTKELEAANKKVTDAETKAKEAETKPKAEADKAKAEADKAKAEVDKAKADAARIAAARDQSKAAVAKLVLDELTVKLGSVRTAIDTFQNSINVIRTGAQ